MSNFGTIGIRKKCPECSKFFAICKPCYRRHRYCSKGCSQSGRRNTFKRSSELYRLTPKGRNSHRERQKRYRKNRQLKNTETQHSSEILQKSLDTKLVTSASSQEFASSPSGLHSHELRCFCCRRLVRWFINSS